jgi:GH15 family glucan-1,4-alpha-glucosidase
VGFLPFDDVRVQHTIDSTLQRLNDHGLIYRYLTADGLPGQEGAFLLTTCWAVNALSLSGRLQEALLERVQARANTVGLFAEQFDPTTGRFLGNFPQAYSHIGLINSALYLARALGRKPAAPAPMGSREHRLESGHDAGAAA